MVNDPSCWEGLLEEFGMDEIGPVDYAVIEFPGNKFTGNIVPALNELVEAGTIRLIDVAFVSKDENGNVAAAELTEVAPDVQKAFETLHVDVQGLFSSEELITAAEELEPNTSAALLVWENVWARKVAGAIRGAGGMLTAFERVPHAVVQQAREWTLAEAAEVDASERSAT
jgi:uncharacterized membrane protein